MSVKSTIIEAVKDVLNSYTVSIENLQKAYGDNRFTDYGKHKYTDEVLNALNTKIRENMRTVTDLTNSVSAIYVEREAAEAAKIANNADYQMLLASVMQQLPMILECSEPVIKARLEMFKNDPVAREMFIKKNAPLSVIPDFTLGRSSELLLALQSRVNTLFLATQRSLDELIPSMMQEAKIKTMAVTLRPVKQEAGEDNIMSLNSFLAYLKGFNEDCTDFDAAKVDREKAGYEIMFGRDFAGEIAKKYGGQEIYDLEEAANYAAFKAHFTDENGNYIYKGSSAGGGILFESASTEGNNEEGENVDAEGDNAGSEGGNAGSEGNNTGSEGDDAGSEGE